ncbi:MAG: ribosomal RNA small subunit methyltransferase A [Bdellovibrionales bacterium]|nr:ribosomal RNA small subunit methyltransferase A [Bdellovibrionales bacterium]
MSESLRQKIEKRMQELGIAAKRSLGQNFLVSDNTVDRIIAAAEPRRFQQVVEIGPGLGSLTDLLKEQNQSLKLYELDRNFCEYWREQGLQVIEGDVLKTNWSDFAWGDGGSLLVSNLPYQISSRLVVDLSIRQPTFDRMVLMFQKEVGKRIMAKPSSEDYGLLTVIAQAFWEVDLVLEAGAVDFFPRPNVASRVLKFDYHALDDRLATPHFLKFVKAGFENRRKKLNRKLESLFSKAEVAEAYSRLSLKEDIRVEALSVEQIKDLYLILSKTLEPSAKNH